jgi:hypothetical protein
MPSMRQRQIRGWSSAIRKGRLYGQPRHWQRRLVTVTVAVTDTSTALVRYCPTTIDDSRYTPVLAAPEANRELEGAAPHYESRKPCISTCAQTRAQDYYATRTPSITTPRWTEPHVFVPVTVTNCAKSLFTSVRIIPHSRPSSVHQLVSARPFSSSRSTMTAQKLDGTAIAKSIRERLAAEVVEKQKLNPKYQPSLKIIQGMLGRLQPLRYYRKFSANINLINL